MIARPSHALQDDLVTANRILFDQKIVDGFGHISARNDADPTTFVMSQYVAPGLVETSDLRVFDFTSTALENDGARHYSERYIHGAIYAARPDVQSVIHCHAAPLLPFGVSRNATLKPVFHMCGFLGAGARVFEIRETAGMTDMLIRTPERGAALAADLGSDPIILMRGHGATMVGASIKQVVYRSVYAAQNATVQMQAIALGDVTYLSEEEAALFEGHATGTFERPWSIWKREALG